MYLYNNFLSIIHCGIKVCLILYTFANNSTMVVEEQAVHDRVGPWSEVKLDIIRKYAKAYSTILSKKKNPSFYHLYIDAFAGSGIHISHATGEFVPGSPLNALYIEPRFREYHYIDLDTVKVKSLEEIAGKSRDISL